MNAQIPCYRPPLRRAINRRWSAGPGTHLPPAHRIRLYPQAYPSTSGAINCGSAECSNGLGGGSAELLARHPAQRPPTPQLAPGRRAALRHPRPHGRRRLRAFLVGGGGADITEVANTSFLAQLEELDASRAQLDLLRDDPNADTARVETLETRITELEDATFIGYIERDGDAPREGALVPDFRLLNLDGEPFQLSALGKPAIVNFWGSWCAFCIEEMPDFQRLHLAVGDRVEVIGINRAESLATALQFAGETGADYTLLLDLDDVLAERGGPYQIVGMPTTLYVRADGTVDTVKIGFHTFEEMSELTNRLLDEKVEFETEPVDTSFITRAGDLLDSQTANHAVANELFARLAADPTVLDDIAWQRNVTAQARIWWSTCSSGARWSRPAPPAVLTPTSRPPSSCSRSPPAWLRPV